MIATQTKADAHYLAALSARDRILSGQNNQTLAHAWADVIRHCAHANDARQSELAHKAAYSYADNQWFVRLDRVWDYAKGQLAFCAKRAA